jgi:chromosome segregation ATPase
MMERIILASGRSGVPAPEQAEDVVGTARQLAADMSGFLGHVEGLAQAYDRLRDEFDRLASSHERLRQQHEAVSQELDDLRAAHRALGDRHERARSDAADVAARLESVVQRLRG